MLTIRMQRTGRKGHAQFRVVVQDSRTAPSSGKVVAHLGSYNPHTKEAKLNIEKCETFMSNGAQPSDRVVKLFEANKLKLPKWVVSPVKKDKSIKKSDKLRRNRPAEEKVEEPKAPAIEAEAPSEEAPVEETPVEAEVETAAEAEPAAEAQKTTEEKPTEEA
ncbi:MAG: 30S ribosomal protein S16 [bacterium]|nr:30S ribosomal protein S16 [bacterium]